MIGVKKYPVLINEATVDSVSIDPRRCQNETLKSTMKSVAEEPQPSPPEKKPTPVIPAYFDIHTRHVAAVQNGPEIPQKLSFFIFFVHFHTQANGSSREHFLRLAVEPSQDRPLGDLYRLHGGLHRAQHPVRTHLARRRRQHQALDGGVDRIAVEGALRRGR